jgi:hypothetical protein
MISKEREERIIRKVMEKLSKKEKIRVRRKKIFGYDTKDHIDDDNLRALGNGIIKDGCVGNSNHNEDGEFDDYDSKGSYSLSGKGCKRKTGQYKRSKDALQGDRSPCGRKNRKKLCKEDIEERDTYIRKRLEMLIRDTIKDEISKAAKRNNCTMQDILSFINTYEKAEKGRLDAKPKT